MNAQVQVHAQSTRVRSAHLNNTTLYKCINRLDITVRPKYAPASFRKIPA